MLLAPAKENNQQYTNVTNLIQSWFSLFFQ